MSFKVVKTSSGAIVAFGPNDANYEPMLKNGEILTIEETPPLANVNAPTLAAITALEATVTPRRVREAVTSPAGYAWLANVDAEIAALRGSLVK